MRGKMFRSILVSLVLLLGLTCMASAEEYVTNGAGTLGYENGTYTATYTECQAEQQYVLLVVKKTDSRVISADTIMYIDQAKSDADGDVTFTFIPKSTPDCEVLLGGVFPNGEGETPVTSPVVLGELIGKGVEVTGKVSKATAPVVQLGTGDRENFVPVYTAEVAEDGTFTFTGVVEGEYALQITQEYYITYYKAIVEVSADNASIGTNYKMYAGDIVPSGVVNVSDLTLLLRNYGSTEETPADINESGVVNVSDLSLLLGNYGKSAESIAE